MAVRAALWLLLMAPVLAQGAAQEHSLTALGTVVAALIVVWTRRCKQLPQYMPGDVRPTLKQEAPRPKAAAAPAPTAAVAAAPAESLEFAPPQTPVAAAEDLVFEAAEKAPEPPPPPEPELDPAELESRFLEIQGQFEEHAAQLAQRLEREWKALEEFISAAPGTDSPEALAIPDVVALGPEPRQTMDPVPPPDEIDGKGWSEPAENGVRSRDGEFLGPLADPGQPPSPTNARAYYRERRVEEEGLVFREITRGMVVGKRLVIQESARYPEQGIPTLLELHKQRAAEAGVPVAYRVWLTRDKAIRIFGTKTQVQLLEPILLELPEAERARVSDILVARDLGGRVDWEGNPIGGHAVLADEKMLALRHGLEPDALRAALARGLADQLQDPGLETRLTP